jgi:hypothetical protein
VASDGGIFAYGDARFFGSTGNIRLNQPIVGMASTPSGKGYWLVASDGGIFAYGDARFFGSTGNIRLNQPIVGMASTPSGSGYWLVASDGGIFAYGDARFYGSTSATPPAQAVVGIATTPSGLGYWITTRAGAVYANGDAAPLGSLAATPVQPIVDLAPAPDGSGFWLVGRDGAVYASPLGAPGGPGGSTPTGGAPTIGSCPVFPADNAWNTDISKLPVHPSSATWVSSITGRSTLYHDFFEDTQYGIPYVVVGASQPLVPVTFDGYPSESDPGPYPIPVNAPVEGGGDRHVIVVDTSRCKLYELFDASRVGAGPAWRASNGAVFDLRSNALRPETWTSADAAGLPIFAGLARYDEVAAGAIRHALRFTVRCTQRGYIHPATHQAGSSNTSCPPMGARFRLRASFDLSGYRGQARVILEALKTYGLIVADNGSDWFINGTSDPRWDDADLNQLRTVPGSSFEVVDTGPVLR